MPSHFHTLMKINNARGSISEVVRDIKKYSAWDIMDIIEDKGRIDLLMLFNENAKDHPKHKRKFWMSRFDDEVIRNQKMFWTKLKYIHDNPVKAGLVNKPEEYKYSSVRNYVNNDNSLLYVNTSYTGIEIR